MASPSPARSPAKNRARRSQPARITVPEYQKAHPDATDEEIAEQLGLRPSTVRKHRRRTGRPSRPGIAASATAPLPPAPNLRPGGGPPQPADWEHPDAAIRLLAASDPRTSSDAFSMLVTDPDPYVREAAAANRSPEAAAWLGMCVMDEDRDVRAAAAANPNCDPRDLRRLAADPSPIVVLAAAENPSADYDTVALLAASEYEGVREEVARRDGPPVDAFLARFARDTSDRVRTAAAGNPSCSAETLDILSDDDDEDVREATAGNKSASAGLLRQMLLDPCIEVSAAAGRNPNCPADQLRVLAAHPDEHRREQAAANPSTPDPVLAELASDHETNVAAAALGNPSCPAETVAHATRSWNRRKQLAAVGNPSCPAEHLGLLAGGATAASDSWEVRVAAASNPNCPPSGLLALVSDPALSGLSEADAHKVYRAVIANPNTPSEAFGLIYEPPGGEAQNPYVITAAGVEEARRRAAA